MLGTLAALALVAACAGAAFTYLIVIFSLSAGGKKKDQVPSQAVLVLDLSMNLRDAPPERAMAGVVDEVLFGSSIPQLYLLEVVDAIERASKDPNIKGLFLTGSFLPSGYGSGLAALADSRPDAEHLRDLAGSGVLVNAMLMAVPSALILFGEEFGWTGYLLPKLIPLGRWRAALLYGAIWGAWHAPIIVAGYNYPGYPVAGVAMMILFTSAIALLQAGLWLRSGSVLLTSFVHAGINSQARGIWPLVVVGVHPLLGGATGLIGIAVLALAGAAVLRTAPRA